MSFLFYCVANYSSLCDEKYKPKLTEEIQKLFSVVEERLQTLFFQSVPIPYKFSWKTALRDNIRDLLVVS